MIGTQIFLFNHSIGTCWQKGTDSLASDLSLFFLISLNSARTEVSASPSPAGRVLYTERPKTFALHRRACTIPQISFPHTASPRPAPPSSALLSPVQSSPVQFSPFQSSPVRSSPAQPSPTQPCPTLPCLASPRLVQPSHSPDQINLARHRHSICSNPNKAHGTLSLLSFIGLSLLVLAKFLLKYTFCKSTFKNLIVYLVYFDHDLWSKSSIVINLLYFLFCFDTERRPYQHTLLCMPT